MIDYPTLIGCTWTDLADRLDAVSAMPRWGHEHAALADIRTLDGLLAATRDRHRVNPVLHALLHLAAADGDRDDDALLVLLHLLRGTVLRLVRQLGDINGDVAAVVLAELTCQIRAYRLGTRPGSVVTGLELDTRRAVLDDLLLRDRYHVARPVEHFDLRARSMEERSASVEEDLDIVDMLLWAARRGVPIEDLELLLASERARGTFGSRADIRLAAERGISRSTLLRRRARTLTALRELAPAYLGDVA